MNPFQFGVIRSTDSHTGLSSAEEPNFWGKMAFDSIPENKQGRTIADGPTGWTMQAAGLAAVWADSNTEEGIVDAFTRRDLRDDRAIACASLRATASRRKTCRPLTCRARIRRRRAMGGTLGQDGEGRAPASSCARSATRRPLRSIGFRS